MQKKWKIAAIITSLIPIGFFLMFAIGEGSGGTGHYVQVAPLIALVILGWYWPDFAGYALITSGLVFGGWYATSISTLPLLVIGLVELVVFVPVLCAGYFFLRADQEAESA
jgi:hypothetical protein